MAARAFRPAKVIASASDNGPTTTRADRRQRRVSQRVISIFITIPNCCWPLAFRRPVSLSAPFRVQNDQGNELFFGGQRGGGCNRWAECAGGATSPRVRRPDEVSNATQRRGDAKLNRELRKLRGRFTLSASNGERADVKSRNPCSWVV